MSPSHNRRQFLRHLGLSSASLPFLLNLPSLGFANPTVPKKRLVVMFTPNGIVPSAFWPDKEGTDFALTEILKPLEPMKDRTLILRGVCNRVRGDGDAHMRGMGCLLTGIELFPGNIQGGSHTPAGWSSGLSIDQEIANFLQKDPATRTRFGSLEFGVLVPDRADTWTRMVYAGPNRPIAPVDNPYHMFSKLYGKMKDRETLSSVLDEILVDFDTVSKSLSTEDRQILDETTTFVREMEKEMQEASQRGVAHEIPEMEPGIEEENDNMPKISKMQIELLVNSFLNDFTRISTLQFTQSVGGAKMRWLGIEENHHSLSHEPDSNKEALEKLIKINRWYCQQLAHLAQRLAETPEPGGPGSLLDNTVLMWTNELGKGNSHTLDNIPFALVGGGLGFKMGQSLKFKQTPHNRLLLSLAHGFGHEIKTFGKPEFCAEGPLPLS